jgi:hypothetical protein
MCPPNDFACFFFLIIDVGLKPGAKIAHYPHTSGKTARGFRKNQRSNLSSGKLPPDKTPDDKIFLAKDLE